MFLFDWAVKMRIRPPEYETSICDENTKYRRLLPFSNCAAAATADLRQKFVSDRLDEENPFVQNSSVLLVQPDEGVLVLVVDRIGDYLPQSTEKSRVLVIPVGARHKCQQEVSPEDQLEDEKKEAGEEKKRASKQLKEQPA
ncbi:hypothetical protein F511_40679 [Dorcoceras hygrometricum]|uniref:Uncharacterized protein n=1 Tax=Dorcoceras hygrometricum TaxID=472368 RepID=A0A2Z7BZL3_9LAMI|nr:hypothetical protein F511_40679 [Dorcoceras hygrometricum]